MSGGRALLITIVVSVALAAAGLFFLAKPKYDAIYDANEGSQVQLQKKLDEIAKLRQFETREADLDREIASLQQQLESMRKIVPDEKEADQFIRSVQDKASEAGVVIRRYTSKPVSTREFYSELPFEIELDGRYYQVLNFFDRVRGLERIVNIKGVQMSQPEIGQQAIKLKKKYNYGPDTTVVATCQALTFFTPEPKPTTAPAAPAGPGQPGRPGPPPAGR